MNNCLQALLWELWRTSRVELALRVVLQIACVLFVCVVILQVEDPTPPTIQVVRGIVLMLLTYSSIGAVAWLSTFDNKQLGFSFRLGFTRPITTRQLVGVPMLFTIVASVLSYLVSMIGFGLLLSQASVPLAGPSAIVACVSASLLAAIWAPSTKAGRLFSIIVVVFALLATPVVFHALRNDPEPLLLAIGRVDYFAFAWYEYLALAAMTAGVFAFTVASVDRQRHGEPGLLNLGLLRLGRRDRLAPERPSGLGVPSVAGKPSASIEATFSSPWAAQYWYEFRRFGVRTLLIGVAAPILALAFLSVVNGLHPSWGGVPFVWLALLLCSPLVYQIIGVDGALGLRVQQGAVRLSAFDGVRPMRNDQLIAIKLSVVAGCSLIGWFAMAAMAALHATLLGDWPQWRYFGRMVLHFSADVPVYAWLVALPVAVLAFTSSSSMMMAFGLWLPRRRRLFTFVASVSVYLHLVALFLLHVNYGWNFAYLWITYGWGFSVIVVAACGWSVYKAIQSGFLGRRMFATVFCLWLVYVASMAVLCMQVPFTIPPAGVAALIAMLLTPLATTAMAPLALASHRHA